MSKKFVNPSDFILPIDINGMDGRYLRIEGVNRHTKKEILFIYDLEANLEKWWGLAVALANYGNLTMVDLPGLGGMDSFYSIGLKPTLNNMADYIASFIKLKYKRKRLSIVGVGFGFVLVTRMLQRNPDLTGKVNLLICLNGYAHKDDFIVKPLDKKIMQLYSTLFSDRLLAGILKISLYNTPALLVRYPLKNFKSGKNGPSKEFMRQFKVDLIKNSDLRTRMFLKRELLKLDNCNLKLNIPLWHITTSNSDKKTDRRLAEQHFRVIFKDYHQMPAKVGRTIPLVLNDPKTAVKYLPGKVRREIKAHG